MGQKVNPHGLRVGVIKDWDSRWFAKDDAFGDILVEDYKLRKFLKKTLYGAGVPRIEIERDAAKVRIHIHCARPGMVIGRGGADIEKLRQQCEKMINEGKETPVEMCIRDRLARVNATGVDEPMPQQYDWYVLDIRSVALQRLPDGKNYSAMTEEERERLFPTKGEESR